MFVNRPETKEEGAFREKRSSDDCSSANQSHIRAMLRALHSLGMPETEKRPDCWVLSEELSKQGSLILYQAWTCESLLYALREIELEERCHWRVVLRCYGQAKLYVGRTHEMVASCYVNDAMFAVGEALAERIHYFDRR